MSNVWDKRYEEAGKAFGEQVNTFLEAQQPILALCGKRALCLGEGEGRNAIWLAQAGFSVTAVDLSSVGLQHAAKRAEQLGVTLQTVQADLTEWPIEEGAWDLVVSIFCHLPESVRGSIYGKVIRGMAPGAYFIAESYRPSQIARGTGGPSDARLLVTAAQLREELAGLEFLHLVEMSREVLEGALHTGISDVVQVVARKSGR